MSSANNTSTARSRGRVQTVCNNNDWQLIPNNDTITYYLPLSRVRDVHGRKEARRLRVTRRPLIGRCNPRDAGKT